MAQERAQQSHGARLSEQVWRYVVEKLHATWSPEQIGAVGEREGIRISHARIYQYIKADAKMGGQLYRQLRCQKMRRKQYGSGKNRRGTIPNQVSIDLRPEVVAKPAPRTRAQEAFLNQADAPPCHTCGAIMVRSVASSSTTRMSGRGGPTCVGAATSGTGGSCVTGGGDGTGGRS